MRLIIFFLLCLSFCFSSCSEQDEENEIPLEWNGNWNDPNDPNYVPGGYNPVQGEWQVQLLNGEPYEGFLLHKFSSSFGWYIASAQPSVNENPAYEEVAKYIINNKALKSVEGELIIPYTVSENKLVLTEGSVIYTLRPYIKNSWEDDWNDPSNPNYKPEGYNPILGEWLVFNVNGQNSSSMIYRFTDEFNFEIAYFDKIMPGDKVYYNFTSKYKINDKAFKGGDKLYYYNFSTSVEGENILVINVDDNVYMLKPFNTSLWTEWGGDWNDHSNPNYKPEGYNPILGEWLLITKNSKPISSLDLQIYEFSSDFNFIIKIARELGLHTSSQVVGRYIINDKGFYDGECIYSYTIKNIRGKNILELEVNGTIYTLEGYNGWKWKGDWNDSSNPNYKPEGYNPVLGNWKVNDIEEFYFKGNLDWIRKYLGNKGVIYSEPSKININDIGLKLLFDDRKEPYYKYFNYEFIDENNHLYLYLKEMYPERGKLIKLEKIE